MINEHAGRFVTYTVDWDDGSVNISDTKNNSHIYTTPGVYVINVTAVNGISSATFQVSRSPSSHTNTILFSLVGDQYHK